MQRLRGLSGLEFPERAAGIALARCSSSGVVLNGYAFISVRCDAPGLVGAAASSLMLPIVLLFSTTNALGEEITYRLALLVPALMW